ncbi:MAG: CRTAC1 family protein [Flavobacteriales bacterium]|nr:CRTAC1 family protein [Flavobacteriales bacterium]
MNRHIQIFWKGGLLPIRFPNSIRVCASVFIMWAILFSAGLSAQFIDKASDFGIQHLYLEPGWGAGLSITDINGDGLDDLSLSTNSGQAIQIYLQTEEGLELFFEQSLIEITDRIRTINWVDYDNDGDKDLFLSHGSPLEIGGPGITLYRQDSIGHFEDVTSMSGLDPLYTSSYGSAWADYDRDGHLDLYLSTYLGPITTNYLFRNLGDGTFEEVAGQLGLQDVEGPSFTSVFFDADLDGTLDLITANDRHNTVNRFYKGNPDGTFTDHSSQSQLNVDMDGMGVDVGDYDSDGDLDIYITNTPGGISDSLRGNLLFENKGGLQFSAISNFPFGVDIAYFWGCSFLDFDNDRDLDIFTVAASRDIQTYSGLWLFENLGEGLYTSYSGSEFNDDSDMHFGSAQGDLNNDGWIDLGVLTAYMGNSQVWMATPGENNWIKLHLEGTVSNREAIGSLIEVWVDGEKRIDYTGCGNSFASQDSDTYPFGLGTATQADSVIIHWPNGHINVAYDLEAGERYVLVEDVSTYELILDAGCSEILPTPVGLEKTFNPVGGVQDRIQLYWYKESPDERYTDEDAAACDIKYWPTFELDPLTGEVIGKGISDPDTLLIPNAKKFHMDGSPRGIYKWPVKFKAEGANNTRRVDPNRRYEWQVRCSCGHGTGTESEWSATGVFDTPDYNMETGVYEGILPGDEGLYKSLSETQQGITISPNPIARGEIHVYFKGPVQGRSDYRVIDLMGREVLRGQGSVGKAQEMMIRLEEELMPSTYLLELRTNRERLLSRFLVSNN